MSVINDAPPVVWYDNAVIYLLGHPEIEWVKSPIRLNPMWGIPIGDEE